MNRRPEREDDQKLCVHQVEIRDCAKCGMDFDRYQELSLIMRRVLLVHGVDALDQPEYQTAWGESEQIKNRNGGMPPTN